MSSYPICLGQEHQRHLRQHMDLYRRWLLVECAHRHCCPDTPTTSCVEIEDEQGAENLRHWHTYVGLTVSC